MKILIYKFPYSSVYGGGERHTINLVESLTERGFTFYLETSCPVLLEEFKKRNWHAKKLWAAKEPVTKAWLFLFILTTFYVKPRLIINLLYYKFVKKIDAIYCLSLTEKILISPFAKLMGLKIYWVEHTLIERWLSLNPYKYFYKAWSPFVQIITVSNAIKYQLIEQIGIQNNRIKTIYPGINLEDYAEQKSFFKNIADQQYAEGLQDKFVIGAVCRLSKEKGIEFLIQAISLVKNTLSNVQCIIVGDGPEKKHLQWLAKTLDVDQYIRFVGFQKNLIPWYNVFDVFVLPSIKKEAFGIVLIEAMANSIPVIASDIGGIPEILKDNETGRLIKPGNKEELAQAILDVKSNYQEYMDISRQGQEMVLHRFTKDAMIQEFFDLFTFDINKKTEQEK